MVDSELYSLEDALQDILRGSMHTAHDANLRGRPNFLWFRPGWRVQALIPYDRDRLQERWQQSKGNLYREALRPGYRKLAIPLKRNLGGQIVFACLVLATVIAAFLLFASWWS